MKEALYIKSKTKLLKKQDQPTMIDRTLQTQDFYCSAYLMAVGIDLVDCTQARDRTTFAFPDTDDTRSHISKYYSLAALINPVAYGNAIRNLKSAIHSHTDLTITKRNVTQIKEYNAICQG
jgi:hypothetical protein